MLDVLGFTQTDAAHEAVMKVVKFDDESDIEGAERYLWALSMGSHPTLNTLVDILKLSQDHEEKIKNIKLHETILLTLAALTRNYIKNPINSDKLRVS